MATEAFPDSRVFTVAQAANILCCRRTWLENWIHESVVRLSSQRATAEPVIAMAEMTKLLGGKRLDSQLIDRTGAAALCRITLDTFVKRLVELGNDAPEELLLMGHLIRYRKRDIIALKSVFAPKVRGQSPMQRRRPTPHAG